MTNIEIITISVTKAIFASLPDVTGPSPLFSLALHVNEITVS